MRARVPPMSGKQLQDAAVSLARSKGYLAAHFSPARVRDSFITNYAYDAKGFPDLVLVGPKKVIVVEVKGTGDSMGHEQVMWLHAFHRAGIETLILTPRAWRDGELERML